MNFLKHAKRLALDIRADGIYANIKNAVNGNKILDFGSGWGNFTNMLRKQNYKVTPVDIVNKSLYSEVNPIIYDGKVLNFKEKKFDTALVITVLHHTPNPEELLKELSKVSKKIIVVEDIYSNSIHQQITYFFDCLVNWEWKGHPHSNKTDKEWKDTFKNLGLKLIEAKYKMNSVIFRHGIYVLDTM